MAHIIIVEEESSLLMLLMTFTRSLCSSSTKISGVNNGQQALQVYEEAGADLIISDHQMPVMNGPELVRTLRSRGVTIPIVLSSGNPGVAAEVYEAGTTLFVEKTQLTKQLSTIISRYLPQPTAPD